MKIRKTILYAVLAALCCGVGLSGCVKTEVISTASGIHDNVTMQLSVNALADASTSTDGTPTAEEAAIHSLRVYAFVDGQPAGHYFHEGELQAPASFLIDLRMFSETLQTVDFYVVANEKGMRTPGSSEVLTENTTEAELNSFHFTQIATENGLPMFAHKKVEVNMSDLADSNPQTVPGHEGHYLIAQSESFELQRPFGKLGVFAAKQQGESGDLKVTGVTVLEEGTRFINYLMPQTDEVLKAVGSKGTVINLPVSQVSVDKELAPGITAEERQNPANYTPVLSAPFYPFESPWGSPAWNMPGDAKGIVLQIDFNFDGDARQGLVYMPRVERNHYYAICCLMNNSGKITVEYTVADWNDGEPYDLDFAYPTYVNPLEPIENHTFEQPTVYYNPDESSEAGTFSGYFTMTAPVGQEWQPTLLNSTPGDYEIAVFQEGVQVSAPYLASEKKYRIRVRALKPGNVGNKVELAISYTPKWDPSGTSLLMINGTAGDTKWPGSTDPEKIVIEQVDPTNN